MSGSWKIQAAEPSGGRINMIGTNKDRYIW